MFQYRSTLCTMIERYWNIPVSRNTSIFQIILWTDANIATKLSIKCLLLLDFCGMPEIQVRTDRPSSIRSIPAYPYNYPEDVTCTWYVRSTLLDGFIRLKFIEFSLTTSDYLTIGLGTNMSHANSTVLHLSGIAAPNSLMINGSVIWAEFESIHGWWSGFNIEIHAENMYGKDLAHQIFSDGY